MRRERRWSKMYTNVHSTVRSHHVSLHHIRFVVQDDGRNQGHRTCFRCRSRREHSATPWIPKLFCSPLYLYCFVTNYGLRHLHYVFWNETTTLMVIDKQVGAHRGNIPPKITAECSERTLREIFPRIPAEAVGAWYSRAASTQYWFLPTVQSP